MQAPFARYVDTARGLPEFAALASLFAKAAAGSATVTADHVKAAEGEVANNILNEKFAYDTTGARYGEKYHNSNGEIARDYVPDLIGDHGWSVAPADQANMVVAVKALLDRL